MTEASIYNWEGNRTTPALREIPAVLRFLGYSSFPSPQSLPEKLVLYRRTMGVSRKRMAKTLGIDESTLARWETGKGYPTKRSLKIIEAILELGDSPLCSGQ